MREESDSSLCTGWFMFGIDPRSLSQRVASTSVPTANQTETPLASQIQKKVNHIEHNQKRILD
ncbi:unnamed protein product [Leptidea sinapis]|uniref:Uncharacterized protein n=1 Tax=Leptidea sinapis TaxID=189913 RepID=A0A5E4PMS8_9NEOP|nr:unnamed protein product [Leptidea sinapis]